MWVNIFIMIYECEQIGFFDVNVGFFVFRFCKIVFVRVSMH
jgi:hypothetical protein